MMRSGRPDATLLAGWLFADLLLGLMVVFLAAAPGAPPPPTPTPTVTATATATATASATTTAIPTATPTWTATPTKTATAPPTPTPTQTQTETPTVTPTVEATKVPFQSGVDKVPTVVSVVVNLDRLMGRQADQGEERRVRQLLHDAFAGYEGQRRAGIVLTAVNVRSGDQAERRLGIAAAGRINALLAAELPLVFGDAASDGFFNVDPSNVGLVELRIYMLLEPP